MADARHGRRETLWGAAMPGSCVVLLGAVAGLTRAARSGSRSLRRGQLSEAAACRECCAEAARREWRRRPGCACTHSMAVREPCVAPVPLLLRLVMTMQVGV